MSRASVSSLSPLPPIPYPAASPNWIQWKQVHWGRDLAQKIVFFPFSNMVKGTHVLLWCIVTGGLWTQCIKQITWAANNVVCIPVYKQGFGIHRNQWQKAAFQISLFKPCNEALLCQKSVEQIEVMHCWIPALWESLTVDIEEWKVSPAPSIMCPITLQVTKKKVAG